MVNQTLDGLLNGIVMTQAAHAAEVIREHENDFRATFGYSPIVDPQTIGRVLESFNEKGIAEVHRLLVLGYWFQEQRIGNRDSLESYRVQLTRTGQSVFETAEVGKHLSHIILGDYFSAVEDIAGLSRAMLARTPAMLGDLVGRVPSVNIAQIGRFIRALKGNNLGRELLHLRDAMELGCIYGSVHSGWDFESYKAAAAYVNTHVENGRKGYEVQLKLLRKGAPWVRTDRTPETKESGIHALYRNALEVEGEIGSVKPVGHLYRSFMNGYPAYEDLIETLNLVREEAQKDDRYAMLFSNMVIVAGLAEVVHKMETRRPIGSTDYVQFAANALNRGLISSKDLGRIEIRAGRILAQDLSPELRSDYEGVRESIKTERKNQKLYK